MTKEELRDYVEEQRTLNNIPYHVYSTLIDGIDTLEPESKPILDKPHIKGDYYDGLRTAKWRYGKLRDEIDLETRVQVKHYTNTDAVIDAVLDVIDKHKTDMEDTK